MISQIKRLAREAGRICLQDQGELTPDQLAFKSPKDLVTETDRQVEAFLVKEILSVWPDHGILGEETGTTQGSGPYQWIIDPIDGTTSFVHNQPFYAVSIGLEKNKVPILGVVYAPVLDQMFFAELNKGAYLNDRPIGVSSTRKIGSAVMATGFACLRSGREPNNLDHFNRIAPRLRDIRRYGSAALDLCYTASGSLDGYWEMNLNPYDISAGAVILKEAGGIITDFQGGIDFPKKVLLLQIRFSTENWSAALIHNLEPMVE